MSIARYDFEEMYAAATKVQKEADELQTLIVTVNSVVEELKAAWTDAAQMMFENEWQEMSGKLKQYVPIMEEYSAAINKHARRIEESSQSI